MSAPVTYPPHYPISQVPNIVTPYPGPIHPMPPANVLSLTNQRPSGLPTPYAADQFANHSASNPAANNMTPPARNLKAMQPKFGMLPDCGIISIPAGILACCCCCALLIVGGILAGGVALLRSVAK
ncbi:MAG: hypothetical protein VKJ04_10510 [Vampirovibrionales bacterium]|nr:hypothetical protein [Vampirovibrionales bacterium]